MILPDTSDLPAHGFESRLASAAPGRLTATRNAIPVPDAHP
jgi:hypothetical protein